MTSNLLVVTFGASKFFPSTEQDSTMRPVQNCLGGVVVTGEGEKAKLESVVTRRNEFVGFLILGEKTKLRSCVAVANGFGGSPGDGFLFDGGAIKADSCYAAANEDDGFSLEFGAIKTAVSNSFAVGNLDDGYDLR